RNLNAIEERADADTLVLIDEIGSGTDPAEGGAIAASLLESLTRRGAYTIATTHHSALKVFAHETEGIENGAMEFDQAGLTPTYRFKPGVPGSSYALEMAQRIGFKEDVLKRSRELMGSQQAQLERLITDLESSSAQYQKELDEVTAEKSKVQLLIQQYESKIAAQSSELREMKRVAIEEAKTIIGNANAVIERSIREIKEHSADKNAIQAAREEVRSTMQQIRIQSDELNVAALEKEKARLEVGDDVSLKGGSQTGEITSISPDKKSALVVFGNVKMKVAMQDLTTSKKNSREVSVNRQADSEAHTEALRDLDLRGMSGDEAIPLVDKFIDTAILAGLHRVDVIHGKGTGVLRKKITDFLSTHPAVKSFRLGEWNEGGTGATVVELADN
ncbi:MAG: Smr/MutS family protein, partial [bacterium]